MNESDIYVRDHILIEFMLNFYSDFPVEVEFVYNDWKEWLKKKEIENAKRSEI